MPGANAILSEMLSHGLFYKWVVLRYPNNSDLGNFPADTQRWDNIESTSMQRHDVASTSMLGLKKKKKKKKTVGEILIF